jgi:CRISPR/Cas system Type II protein with McrA/HNH and RuvC-like nuclease domain
VKRKRKITQTKIERLKKLEKEMQEFLTQIGYKGHKKESVNKIPDYKTDNYKITSNDIPGNGQKIHSNTYSGTEIAGIVTTHKSNLMPVRKDNKQAAVDAAQMRRN